jgi:hypothetical protein
MFTRDQPKWGMISYDSMIGGHLDDADDYEVLTYASVPPQGIGASEHSLTNLLGNQPAARPDSGTSSNDTIVTYSSG